MPDKPIRHITFSMSAAGSLRQALNLPAGLNDKRVLGCPDDLSYGPINLPDSVTRIDWLQQLLGHGDHTPGDDEHLDDMRFWSGRIAAFWRDALDPAIYPVIWVCRRNAAEYAGFLELVQRLGDVPCDIVDLSDLTLESRRSNGDVIHWKILSSGSVSPSQTVSHSLPDRRAPISSQDRARWRRHWQTLQSENAPFRVVLDGTLTSAHINFYDDFLLSHATRQWQKSTRIIGNALADQENRWSCQQAGDLILWARLRQLALDGRLEYRGDLTSMRENEMRRP